jgi:hypothetical protein
MKVAHRETGRTCNFLKAAASAAPKSAARSARGVGFVGLSHPFFSFSIYLDANRDNSVQSGSGSHVETDEVDWQIWIAQGDRPYPCRYVITSSKVKGSPQYTIDVWNWKTGKEAASDDFTLAISAGCKGGQARRCSGL